MDINTRNINNMKKENTTIFCCTSMLRHLEAAQQAMHTDFPVLNIDRKLHDEPVQLHDCIQRELDRLPEQYEYVLAAMAFCGGGWNHVRAKQRIVIPNMDDCVTMLLQTDDAPHRNLKQEHCFYFRDSDEGDYTVEAMKDRICRQYGTEFGTSIFGSYFVDYQYAPIIDTGVYDCYSEEFVEKAQRYADLIRCDLDYVGGSNRVLEKLVSGHWDEQFLVTEPGEMLCMTELEKSAPVY